MIDLHHVLAYGMNGELYTEDAMNADGDVSAWDVDGSPYVIWESEEADDDAI